MRRARGLAPILVLAFLASCAPRPSRVVFGIALTESGQEAVRLAAAEINSAGGIGGLPLELVGLDWKVRDTFQPHDVLTRVRQFDAMPDLVAVIGPSDSSSTLSAAAVLNRYRIPEIVTIASSPAITRIGDWTYRLCLSDSLQGPALAVHARSDWQRSRAAVFHVNDDYGWGLARAFERRFEELGGTVVATVPLRNELRDDDEHLVRHTARRLASDASADSTPDVVALFLRPASALRVIRAVRAIGLAAPFLGGDSLASARFGGSDVALVEGSRVSAFFIPTDKNAAFVTRFRKAVGREPRDSDAYAYDAVQLLRLAVQTSGVSRRGVKAYLDGAIASRQKLSGVAGDYSIGEDHDARRPLAVAEVRSGALHFLRFTAAP